MNARRKGFTLVEISIYVILAMVMALILYRLLMGGVKMFKKVEGHQEALQAASIVDRIVERDLAGLCIKGLARLGDDLPDDCFLPFELNRAAVEGMMKGPDSELPVARRRVIDLAEKPFTFYRAVETDDPSHFRLVTVSYGLEPQSFQGKTYYHLRRQEAGGSERLFRGAKIRSLQFELLWVWDKAEDLTKRKPLFFIRWTVVGLSSDKKDVTFEDFYDSTIVNTLAVPRLTSFFRPEAPGIFWNTHRSRFNYLESEG